MAGIFEAFNFQQWINENRHLLKPPVANKVIWPNREYIVMVVGGPNERTDFHVNQGEEFFYQLEGTLTLKVWDQGHIRDIRIQAGDIYLLPANTPHSPQREAGSIGLVVESRRQPGQLDGLRWYCEKCTSLLYEETFFLTDIEKQFAAIFERYYSSTYTLCKSCGHKNGRKWGA